MTHKVGAAIAREIREAIPPMIFFLVLFHLIAATKAVVLEDYSFTALRAAGATLGALVVAKAILVVEALPMARWFSTRLASSVAWKASLFLVVVVLFRLLEELIPLISKHGGVGPALDAMAAEVSWPLFGILTAWIFGGLLLYTLGTELGRVLGHGHVRTLLFTPRPPVPGASRAPTAP